ncbi:MAG: Hsp70 family protein, partial [Gluconobacter cerinus]
DNQNAVTIKVYQGEREMAADNKLLGNFDLQGIAPAPRGVPQIEVTFDIDANGIVNVSAKDKATNKEQQIKIQASGGLSDGDIDRMVKEAEANASADKAKRELVELRNSTESMIHQTEKSLTEGGDKVPAADKSEAEAAIAAAREALGGENVETLKSASERLTQAAMKVGQAMYQADQAQQGGEAAGAEAKDENVVDADFEDVDDSKKH